MDIDHIVFVAHDEMDGFICLTAEPLHDGSCAVHYVQIVHDIARHLAQAHSGAVHTRFRVALHVAARAHAREQAVHGGFVQSGFGGQCADGHSAAAAAQNFQQVKGSVERLNRRMLCHFTSPLRFVL